MPGSNKNAHLLLQITTLTKNNNITRRNYNSLRGEVCVNVVTDNRLFFVEIQDNYVVWKTESQGNWTNNLPRQIIK